VRRAGRGSSQYVFPFFPDRHFFLFFCEVQAEDPDDAQAAGTNLVAQVLKP
jgi:hypothetical protein